MTQTPAISFLSITIILTACGCYESYPIDEGNKRTVDDTTPLEQIELSEFDIQPNPYETAALTAVISARHEKLNPEQVTEIRVTVKGKGRASDYSAVLKPSSVSYQANFDMSDIVADTDVGIPVLGLYPDHDNAIEFEISTATAHFTGKTTITTNPLESHADEIVTVSVADTKKMEPGWTYVNNRMYDNDGICRWVGPNIFHLRSDGNITGRTDDFNWLGKKLVDRTLPEDLADHHDNIELPNGNNIICVTDSKSEMVNYLGKTLDSLQDAAVEYDNKTGEIVNAWDLRAFLDVNRATYVLRKGDWFHLNTLCYDEQDDTVIFSGRHQGIAAVTRGGIQGSEPNKGKTLKWILAPHLDWDQSGWNGQGELDPRDYLLTAVDADGVPYNEDVQNNLAPPAPNADDFFWPVGQHGLVLTFRSKNKLRLMTFNNQASYIFDGPDTINNGAWFGMMSDRSNDRSEIPFSQIIEYEIDEAEMTVKKTWSFGEYDPELYGSFQSAVNVLPITGNKMMYSSGLSMVNTADNPRNPTVVEITGDDEVVFYFEIENTELLAYRAGRVDLYHAVIEE